MLKLEQECYETIINYLPQIAKALQEIADIKRFDMALRAKFLQKTLNEFEQKESNNGAKN